MVLLLGAFVIVANIIVDVLYAVIDPRVRRRLIGNTVTHPDFRLRARGSRTSMVHFPTVDGIVKAVDGLSFDLERGKTLGIVGESGSGKSVSSSAILGPAQPQASAQVSRRDPARRRRPAQLSDEEMRKRRGSEVAMIFQDPLSAMHPYYTVGNQIIEAYRVHNEVSKKAAPRRAPSRCSTGSGSRSRTAASTTTRTSSPAACASAR